MDSTAIALRALLGNVLHLGDRTDAIGPDTQLLGGLPELDSLAVANVIVAMEEEFAITVADDDVSAETFETFGALLAFLKGKLGA